jgi:lipoteichoic acid synthase
LLCTIPTKNKKDYHSSIDYLEIIYIVVFMISLVFKCLYFQFDTKLNPKPLLKTDINKYMIISSIAAILSIVAFISLLFYKRRKSALLIANVLITVLIFADIIYFRYYYSALSVSLIYQIGFIGFIGDSIKNLLRVTDIVLVADLPVMLTALLFINKRSKSQQKPIKFSVRIISSILMVVISILTVNAVYVKADSDIYNYDSNHVIKQMGLLYYHYYDAREFE